MNNEFSIKEEIRIEVKENLSNLDVDIDEIYEDVINDELLIDMISLTIYTSIQEKLNQKKKENKEVDFKIEQIEKNIVRLLDNRDII